jgi:dihydroneopterin aldolase
MDRIVLTGIRAMGAHGVLPEEQSRPQPFEVDIELMVDLAMAGRTDALGDTVDYGTLATGVARLVEEGHYRLLEALAARIAEACRADPRVVGVIVTVRKLRPPVGAMLEHVAVRIER